MAKLTLKSGDTQIDYDGPEDFLKDELAELIKAVNALSPAGGRRQGGSSASAGSSGTGAEGAPSQLSVSTIARKLAVKDGPNLIIAAALSFAKSGSDAFTKKQLRSRTREATGFYKATYATNFDKSISRLVKKGRLNHNGGDSYTLPSAELASLDSLVSAGAP